MTVLTALGLAVLSQAPFAADVDRFVQADRANPPAKGQVLFIGSSSFTMWNDVQERFPGVPVLNRAFGGSSLPDLIRYFDRIVTPYEPRRIVIYCGENDLAGDAGLAAYRVVDRFKTLHGMIRRELPSVPIVYVSMKPSPSRWHLRSKFIAGNRWIREFCQSQDETTFIDVWPVMIGPDGWPREELFLEDRLHMNRKGYDLWTEALKPYIR